MDFDAPAQVELEGSLDDLKLIYRVLHSNLADNLELMDSPLFSSLQDTLQQAAAAEGVDVTDHGAWAAWLGSSSPSLSVDGPDRRKLLN